MDRGNTFPKRGKNIKSTVIFRNSGSGSEIPKRKKSSRTALALLLTFFNFSVYYHAKLHTITETHIQTRKLRAVSVFVSYTPFSDSIFRHANTLFRKNQHYPTPFYLSALYYHGNPGLLPESILLPESTIFPSIAILSAASKNPKIGAHHPP